MVLKTQTNRQNKNNHTIPHLHWQWDIVVFALKRLCKDASVGIGDGVGKAGAPNHGREPGNTAIQKALASVVADQEFAAGLLAAIAHRREAEALLGDGVCAVVVVEGGDIVGADIDVDLGSAKGLANLAHTLHHVDSAKQVDLHAKVKVVLGVAAE